MDTLKKDKIFNDYIHDQREINPNIIYKKIKYSNQDEYYILMCETNARYFISADVIDEDLDIPRQVGTLLFSKGNPCFVSMFEVDYNHQGTGIGSTMMDCLKTFCAYRDISAIRLAQIPSNDIKGDDGHPLDTEEELKHLDKVYSSLGFKPEDPSYNPDNPYLGVVRRFDIDDPDAIKIENKQLFHRSFFAPLLTPSQEQ